MTPLGSGKRKPAPNQSNRALIANRALASVQNAMVEGGMSSADAAKYARIALTQKGVTLGKGGSIFYNGKRFDANAFAKSNIVNLVTGVTAKNQNQKLITSDAGYLATLAQLGLTRDQAVAALNMQKQQAEIQFGDPSFITGDPNTAGAAAANPNSTVALLALQKTRADQATNQNANRLGTYFGGGLTSGMNENQRVNVAQNQDAVMKFQNLLAQLNAGIGNAQQSYTVGQNTAYQQAYQDMLKAGSLHAVNPNYQAGQYHYNFPAAPPPPNGGGHAPAPPPPPPHLNGGPTPLNPVYHPPAPPVRIPGVQ